MTRIYVCVTWLYRIPSLVCRSTASATFLSLKTFIIGGLSRVKKLFSHSNYSAAGQRQQEGCLGLSHVLRCGARLMIMVITWLAWF